MKIRQENILEHLSVLTLLTLHSEGLALLHHTHQFGMHNKKYGDDSR